MAGQQIFIDVIMPLPLANLFTYSVPHELANDVMPGKRVVVQFGRKKIYTALVKLIHNNPPTEYETKDILSVLDENPVVNEHQFKFWEWISSYYQCTQGEVFKAALPSGLKLESETKVIFNPDFENLHELSPKEELVHKSLESKNLLTIKEIDEILNQKNSLPVIKSMIEKNALRVEETLKEKFKPKLTTYVKLHDDYNDEDKLRELFDNLSRAPKQLEMLMNYISVSKMFQDKEPLKISKKQMLDLQDASPQVFTALIDKNIFSTYSKETGRLGQSGAETTKPKDLTDFQRAAHKDILEQYKSKDVILLHGVTSSGKTEIYIQLIKEYLERGEQVLYLLPEIAITTQIITRLTKVFGDDVGIYHSKFSDNERVEIWNNVLKKDNKNSYKLILGVRSSVFLPFTNLGLVIVDEEHENSYKQYDPAPRYHARDAAIVLSKLHNAKTLLGTATPSIESYYNAKNAKFGFVQMTQRYQDIQMPKILIADIKDAYRKKQMQSHFTPLLMEKIEEAIENKEQIILFQNRRGFSPYLECNTCNWVPNCEQCDVSLTYHKKLNHMVCHYCGFTYTTPLYCGACGNADIQTRGFGTEKIEDEISTIFPKIRVARMDFDTTRSRKSYERIISEFEGRHIDILVGTQMVTKGLDFDNVSIVGILNADNMLNFPDFRAFERSYQLMAQVSGRAGRKHKQGQVIIQTSSPKHHIIQSVVKNDYHDMFMTQLSDRKKFRYPPYYKLIDLSVKHKKKDVLNKAAKHLGDDLRKIFGNRVLGPEYPAINRIQNWYIKKILVKIEKEKAGNQAKDLIRDSIARIKQQQEDKTLQVVIDVDPM